MSLLRTRYIRAGWKIDEAAAERALAYCRGYAADGSDPDDEREAAIDFFHSHGQSIDWVFDGRHGALICGLAAHSKRASSIADAELLKLADEYIKAEQKCCDLNRIVDQLNAVRLCRNYLAAFRVVSLTDLILTMPAHYADVLNVGFDNQILPLPIRTPPLDVYLYWHNSAENDAANR